MKTKYLIALIFLLLGTNLFTYSTTRATTTRNVLTRAQRNIDTAFEKEGFYDFDTADKAETEKIITQSKIIIAGIYDAGGEYYWYNNALFFCFFALLLTVTGVLIPLVQSRKSPVA